MLIPLDSTQLGSNWPLLNEHSTNQFRQHQYTRRSHTNNSTRTLSYRIDTSVRFTLHLSTLLDVVLFLLSFSSSFVQRRSVDSESHSQTRPIEINHDTIVYTETGAAERKTDQRKGDYTDENKGEQYQRAVSTDALTAVPIPAISFLSSLAVLFALTILSITIHFLLPLPNSSW